MKRLLFVVLLLAGALAAPSGPAGAAAGVCSGASGVTVVVQFPDRVDVRCASGDPADGFAALIDAGFQPTRVMPFPGALCQIDSYPDTSCDHMPPTSAYWRYFRASAGGAWSPSNYGASSTNPKPGSFEGWRFGDNAPAPDYAIPAPPKPTSKPTLQPTPAHPTGGTSHPVVGPAGRPSIAPTARSTSGATAAATGTPTAPGTVTRTPTATPGETSTSDPTVTDANSAVEAPTRQASATHASSNHSWIWGVVLVGVLGAAAGVTAVRRRRS